jgi:hypothetical protein
MQRETQIRSERVGVSYTNARKKRVPERRHSLHPAEKEQRSGTFHHKSTSGLHGLNY